MTIENFEKYIREKNHIHPGMMFNFYKKTEYIRVDFFSCKYSIGRNRHNALIETAILPLYLTPCTCSYRAQHAILLLSHT